MSKRLSRNKFHWWPNSKEAALKLSVPQLNNLIWNNFESPN